MSVPEAEIERFLDRLVRERADRGQPLVITSPDVYRLLDGLLGPRRVEATQLPR